MRLFKKPFEIEPRKTLRILIYGEPGIGKSTFALSTQNAVLLDFDRGSQRLNENLLAPNTKIYTFDLWEDVAQALNDIRNSPSVQNIIVDTAGKMLDYMDDYLIREDSRNGKRDGNLSVQGFGARKKMFVEFLNKVSLMGKNVVFVAHVREEKQWEVVKKRPEIGGSSAGDLIMEMDLVGFMLAVGKDKVITFDPNESYYAKNTCCLPEKIKIPILVDKNGTVIRENNTLKTIIDKFMQKQEEKTREIGKYHDLIDSIKKQIENINNAEDANTYISIMQEMDNNKLHIFDSKIVARNLYSEKVKKLGLKYNSETKQYE